MPRTLPTLAVASLAALTLAACGPARDAAPVAARTAATASTAPSQTATTAATAAASTTTTAPATKTTTAAPKATSKPKPSKPPVNANASYFALLKGITKVGNTWWVDYDRAYFCWGEADDDPGCAGPNPIALDDGSWIINNNPAITHSVIATNLKMTLYTESSPPKPFHQGLPGPDQMDHRNGMHWAGADGQGGIWAVIRYDAAGKVKAIEQHWTP